MKNLNYQQVIHIKLWITFLFIFQKPIDNLLFMCYNIHIIKKYIKQGGKYIC